MWNLTKSINLIRKLLILLPAAAGLIFLCDVIYINYFNSQIHTSVGNAETEAAWLSIDTRKDSTSIWTKRDFDLYGETVDLNAQTFDAAVNNTSDYEISDWSFTLTIRDNCFINNAWCGTMEIHQTAEDGEEKVQTLNLRNYDRSTITLDYLYDGDLLIPLSPGDVIVYHPSVLDKENELPLGEQSSVEIGFIFYYLEMPDLTDYTFSYQYNRSYKDCAIFSAGSAVTILWLILAAIFLISRITYRAALREMEMKKSGISAMSDIYSIIYIVDLKTNELIPVLADKESEKLRPKELSAQEQLRHLFEWDSTDVYQDAVISFCDLTTIRERIRGKNTLVCEYISKNYGWCQLRFFAMDRDAKREPEKLIFAIQVIEEEKAELEALHAAVKEKSDNIIAIQQKIVVGMANIIENRDSNTGGHVKRTSDVIRIIVDEIQNQNLLPIDPVLAKDIVRAAPMHDLGKISIDSSILCKPGKLTAEEFAVMKTHSARSGEMVKILLDGVEEEHFVTTAFHIARYHHERWDGRGYPDGLKEEQIPIEARIMAVADVYDALVSKRCYKEPMSFEQAGSIMLDGMGTQFDPGLKDVFIGCRKQLEEYYAENR